MVNISKEKKNKLEGEQSGRMLASKLASRTFSPFRFARGIIVESEEGVRLYPVTGSQDYLLLNPEDITIQETKQIAEIDGDQYPVHDVKIKVGSAACYVSHQRFVVSLDQNPTEGLSVSRFARRADVKWEECGPTWGVDAWF